MVKEKKPMRTALQPHPKDQPLYAQSYPQDHLDVDTHIQEMAQISSIVACVQHSSDHAYSCKDPSGTYRSGRTRFKTDVSDRYKT